MTILFFKTMFWENITKYCLDYQS